MIRRWDYTKPPTGPFCLNRNSIVAMDLMAWWPFGPGSGNFFADMAGNRHHLSNILGVQKTIGDKGQPAIILRGAAGQALYRPSSIPIGSAVPLILAGWFCRFDASGNEDIVSVCTSGVSGRDRFQLFTNGTQVLATESDASTAATASSASNYVTGKWNHGAALFTQVAGLDLRYAALNGVFGTVESTAVITANQNAITIGGVWFDNAIINNFNGMIADVLIWRPAPDEQGFVERPVVLLKHLNDPSTRFEHWYPLRSEKWISFPSVAAQMPVGMQEW